MTVPSKQQMFDWVLRYATDEEAVDSGEEVWCGESIKLIEAGEDIVEHKTVYNSNIYLAEGIYFEVTFSRDNCGYWGDGEHHETTICEVFPKQVTKTVYVSTKPEENQ